MSGRQEDWAEGGLVSLACSRPPHTPPPRLPHDEPLGRADRASGSNLSHLPVNPLLSLSYLRSLEIRRRAFTNPPLSCRLEDYANISFRASPLKSRKFLCSTPAAAATAACIILSGTRLMIVPVPTSPWLQHNGFLSAAGY